jgi:uncharacterized membrane protein YgcG
MSLAAWYLIASLLLPLGGSAQQSSAGTSASTFSTEELQQMLAPVALYPDPLLAQILMASTYPLEVVEAARWVKKNPNPQGEQLDKAVASKNWDPTVTALTHFPPILSMMNENLEWTSKLGDAFLAQQDDVMNAVQYLRSKAQAAGNLQTMKEQTVVVEKQTIRIEPTDPQVIYVPTYNPTVIYGSWWYPAYPPTPIYYPGYYPGAAFAAGAITFGAGMVAGAALAGSFNWYDHDIDIDVNRNVNINRSFQGQVSSSRTQVWQHDATHRRGVAYRDNATSQRFGQTRARQPLNSPAARGHTLADGTRAGQGSRPGDLQRHTSGIQRPAGEGTRSASGIQRQTTSGRRQASDFDRQVGGGTHHSDGFDRHGSGAFGGLGDGSSARMASQRGQMSRSGSFGGGFGGGGRSFGGSGFHGGGFGGGRRR